MLVIEVEYLTGRAVATDRQSRAEPEWPPHPQRLFSALVAACHECEPDDAHAALKWLESLQPPSLVASRAAKRECPESYVPVNDSNAQCVVNRKKRTVKFTGSIHAGIALGRDRKERHFPTVIPDDPVVQFVWNDADPKSLQWHLPALRQLTECVAYLGHSTSLVRMAVVDAPRKVNLCPLTGSRAQSVGENLRLRGITPGRLQLLEDRYTQSLARSRRQEAPDAPWHRYCWTDREESSPWRSTFGGANRWFVFRRRSGRVLPVHSCLALTTSVRRALCSVCDDPLPEILSGHLPDGRPLDQTHIAFVPLANVGYQHSRGELHGFAIVLPDNTTDADRRRIALAVGKVRRVWDNMESTKCFVERKTPHLAFDWTVESVTASERLRTLQPQRYLGMSRCWATATPMVFGHFLRKLDEPRTRRIVEESCEAIGLPRPKHVRVAPTSIVQGVPQSYVFPSLSTRGKPVWVQYRGGKHVVPRRLPDGSAVRMRYHVVMEFEQPVAGPVILGAGRYYGMGLCVPLHSLDSEDKQVTS